MTRQAVGLAPFTLSIEAMRPAAGKEEGSWPGYCREESDYCSERPWEGVTTFLVKKKEQRKDGVSVSWL